jgi:hypothetical protein
MKYFPGIDTGEKANGTQELAFTARDTGKSFVVKSTGGTSSNR